MSLLKIEKYAGPDPVVMYTLEIEVQLPWHLSHVLKTLTDTFGPGTPYESEHLTTWSWSIFWINEHSRRVHIYLTTEEQATFCALKFGTER